MKKLIFLFTIIINVFAFSGGMGMGMNIPNNSQINGNISDKIQTKEDYLREEQALKKLAQLNPANYFMLGILYISDIPLKDGTVIKANIKKAKQAFEIASSNNIVLSDYFLAVIAYRNKDYQKALNILENAMQNKLQTTTNSVYKVLSNFYASIVLDYFNTNTILLKKAIHYLTPVAKENLGSSQFMLAYLYLYLKQENSANFWLTKACSNPNTPTTLLKKCEQFKEGK